MGEPRVTPRVFGRFALELFEGPTLMERVRFDFPMLGGNADLEDAGAGGVRPPVRMTARLRTRIGVLFPATSRGTRLELWDRATDERYVLPWPPKAGVAEPPPRPPLVPETWDVIPAKDAGTRARPTPVRSAKDAGARSSPPEAPARAQSEDIYAARKRALEQAVDYGMLGGDAGLAPSRGGPGP